MYQWIACVVIEAFSEELRRGLRPNTIFQRIQAIHLSRENLQQNNVTQALERVAKVQHKHGLQPFIFDYSNAIVRTIFWENAGTLDSSLAGLLGKRAETLILSLLIKNCPKCW